MQLGCLFANVSLPGARNVGMYSTQNGLQLSGSDVIHLHSRDNNIVLISIKPDWSWWSPGSSIVFIPGTASPGIKRQGREADH
jgi:hypothetical protein